MASLLEEIRSISKDAARTLTSAGFYSDSDIKSLSRMDLNELLPGPQNLQVRKKVFEKIQKSTKSVDVILQELKNFIPEEAFRAALTSNGVLVNYLNVLKDLKGHVNQIQEFIDAHICLLERLRENQDQGQIQDTFEVNNVPVALPSSSGADSQFGPVTDAIDHPRQTHGIMEKPPQTTGNVQTYSQGIVEKPPQTASNVQTCTLVTVLNKTIITGKTLNAHLDVLKQVQKQFLQGVDLFQLQLEEKANDKDCNIIIVFCPVVSRVGTDVESAMGQVPADKDLILVLMHHTREPKTSWSLRTWSRPSHVVLDVNVFFHDAVGGLLTCKENDDAVSEIQRKLLDYSSNREIKQISQNVPLRSRFGSLTSKWF